MAEAAATEAKPYEIKRMPVDVRRNGSIAPMSNPMYKGDPPYTGAWADCAYDPETPGWIHHPDQICVPSEIDEVVRLYTKAVLRAQPDDRLLLLMLACRLKPQGGSQPWQALGSFSEAER